jgi:hypothetical protein
MRDTVIDPETEERRSEWVNQQLCAEMRAFHLLALVDAHLKTCDSSKERHWRSVRKKALKRLDLLRRRAAGTAPRVVLLESDLAFIRAQRRPAAQKVA